jgi:predicted dehydrogenase
MEKTLGIGVIGLGMGCDLFYANNDPTTRFEVRGICSTMPSKVEAIAKKSNIPFGTTDYQRLLERDDIHVIAVFSPDHLHHRHCIDALNADKHIIVTKPMVVSTQEAIDVARR